ncbi:MULTISPECIES: LEA type 2 family protein [Halomicrobium]|uniref:Water stress and hypersensitive response domain-containing protein n=2 Tax=Halomicrobium mukohataei TaxID=57705 RepID=C7NXL5_HALMD|nr:MULTISPECIES: LEA type 2 family protein [Halomicrobium]ACV48449.1 Protein of unknown function DUF1511 [Halomicrobium mukohataei DSM 12286]QCD66855.1 hypothetical protein E5139_14815 [Halomicrobium mukohataei]QFR21665.1 hypothetical protein GBQ70_14830 [Halomicrobium sp. ZPS1]
MRRSLTVGLAGVLGIALVLGGGVALGVLGTPSLAGVDNQFGPVNETTTVVHTDLHLRNPNPIGVRLGNVRVNYSVAMNDVTLASGQRDGVRVPTGNSTLNLTTAIDNEQIPVWWYTHVDNGETTAVDIDARVETPLGEASLGQSRAIETDIAGQFDSTETRPVEANRPFVRDPVLYINRTRGAWDRPNVTRQQTPLDLSFTVYNPKSVPYTVSKVGYDVTMNGVPVGEGETDRGYLLEPRTTETIRANAAIRNDRLDEWWVSHIDRDQVTDLRIDFYLLVEVGEEQFRIDLDAIDYEQRIETDIFGTKATNESATTDEATPASASNDSATTGADSRTTETDSDDGLDPTGSEVTETTVTGTETTPTATPTETDDGILDGGSETGDGVL